ncbi:transporter [Enterococcus villorum]|uniref:Transporter n=1 Tax=Enterococcus villorum TaxID=112904 RepID=A0A1V8YMM9_9ENTE|nr:YitT family protein [Enterococcus villorum]OQO68125.1 transporter [Enterococcus villorum]OQO73576.1 transporter [Enterococcus villorum]
MLKELKKTPVILIGVLFIAIGLNWFLLPHDIASAGVGAIGHLVETAFLIPRAITVWVVNITMLTLSILLLGKLIFVKAVIGSLLFPIILEFIPKTALFYSQFLSLIVGSLLFSSGVYTLYTVGASNGGVTIPPIILQKFFRIPVSRGLLLTNLIIVWLNYLVFGWRETVYVLFSIVLSSFFLKLLGRIYPITKNLE